MNQILFHGKRVDTNEWVEGFYDELYVRPDNRFASYIHVLDAPASFEVIPESVGQYVRINDKNDTKIFEGCVLRGKESRCCACHTAWDHKTSSVIIEVPINFVVRMTPSDLQLTLHYAQFCEVVGNIYDNPELVAVKKGE